MSGVPNDGPADERHSGISNCSFSVRPVNPRAGCECTAHILQELTDLHPNTMIISIDGMSAYDQISRAATLDGLMNVEGRRQAVPFVSSHLWEDASGVTHRDPWDNEAR